MSIFFSVTGIIGYLILGLFVSRWWWRSKWRTTEEDQILACGVVLYWPLTVLGIWLGKLIKWFYGPWL